MTKRSRVDGKQQCHIGLINIGRSDIRVRKIEEACRVCGTHVGSEELW